MADPNPIVVVDKLYKSFKLPHEQSSGLKQSLINIAKRKKGYETQRVLKDISFSIQEGEFFGILGRNGSGKSTLLKLLAGIYTPEKGLVHIGGSLTPFIELGVGFNPELTGRENVYLNGALLGFSREEMDHMYNEIVDFAELERFMDQKLKNYSSGMQVRLAFSIAIRARSDILLIDEVLAVGDSAFQKKCFDYFEKIKAEKKTIILVTHDMSAVERFCDRCILVDKGKITAFGDPYDIASKYAMLNQQSIDEQAKHDGSIQTTGDASLLDCSIDNISNIAASKKLAVHAVIESEKENVIVGISIIRRDNVYVGGINSKLEPFQITTGKSAVKVDIDISNLLPGSYFINVSLYSQTFELLDFKSGVDSFVLKEKTETNKDGILNLPGVWHYESNQER